MAIKDDLTSNKEVVKGLQNNKVTKFCYTDKAYEENDVNGVRTYSFDKEQNIPDLNSLETNATVITKGYRTQASSLARMLVNHIFGRVSYNLNKIVDTTSNLITSIDDALGKPNGIATLDAHGRIPYSQLPESAMEYKGMWNAETNTPTLTDGDGTKGDMYVVSVGGTQTFGGEEITFLQNDQILYDGEVWNHLSAGSVRTVNSVTPDETGNVLISSANIEIKDGAIKENMIASNAVTTAKIASGAVTTAKIADLNVTEAKLASNAVTTAKIADLNVTTAKIADLNVTEAKLASNAVTTAKIADLNVTEAKLASNAVTTAKIADLNVTEAKLASNAVTYNKLADNAVTIAKIAKGAVTTARIADLNVTTAKIKDSAVTTDKIKDANVTTDKIANYAVTTDKIDDEAVSYRKIIYPYIKYTLNSTFQRASNALQHFVFNIELFKTAIKKYYGESAPDLNIDNYEFDFVITANDELYQHVRCRFKTSGSDISKIQIYDSSIYGYGGGAPIFYEDTDKKLKYRLVINGNNTPINHCVIAYYVQADMGLPIQIDFLYVMKIADND